tara:strand:- start:141 stop:431 length:291 start_codon:yes stop_codon:yes gene_type:complete
MELPADYRPRRRSFAIPSRALREAGLVNAGIPHRSGDILLLRTAPAQVHTAIAVDRGEIVHAHAGLRRVVRCALPARWPVLDAWRLNSDGDIAWQR